MIKMGRLILILVLLLSENVLYAQENDSISTDSNNVEKTNDKEPKKKKKPTVKSLQIELEQCQGQLQEYIRKDSATQALMDSLDRSLRQVNSLRAKLVRDSAVISKKMNDIQKQKETADRTTAMFCYIRLAGKYRARWMKDALELWATIDTKSVLEEFKGTDILLKRYKEYYVQVRDIIQQAQDDKKGRFFDDVASTFAAQYISKIRQCDYYKSWYSKDMTIVYLNHQIDAFIKMLRDTKPGKYDFQLLLDYGFPPDN